MHALELEAPIVDHSVTILSDRLPAQAERARVIILYEDAASATSHDAPLAEFLRHPFKATAFRPLGRDEANGR